jgi:hypothetical protein
MFFLEAIALGFFMFCVYVLFFEKKDEKPKGRDHAGEIQNGSSRNDPETDER